VFSLLGKKVPVRRTGAYRQKSPVKMKINLFTFELSETI